jgi:hypothetical protein
MEKPTNIYELQHQQAVSALPPRRPVFLPTLVTCAIIVLVAIVASNFRWIGLLCIVTMLLSAASVAFGGTLRGFWLSPIAFFLYTSVVGLAGGALGLYSWLQLAIILVFFWLVRRILLY